MAMLRVRWNDSICPYAHYTSNHQVMIIYSDKLSKKKERKKEKKLDGCYFQEKKYDEATAYPDVLCCLAPWAGGDEVADKRGYCALFESLMAQITSYQFTRSHF